MKHHNVDLCWGFIFQMKLAVRDVPGQHVAHRSKAEMSKQFLHLDSGENIVIVLGLVQ